MSQFLRKSGEDKFESVSDKLGMLSNTAIVLFIICFCIFLLVYFIVGIFIRQISQNALIGSEYMVRNNMQINFKELWKFGKDNFKVGFVYRFIVFLVGIGLNLINVFLLCSLCCIGFIGGILLNAFALCIYDMGLRYLLYEKLSPTEALEKSYKLVSTKWKKFIVYALIALIADIALIIIVLIIFFLLGILLFILMGIFINSETIIILLITSWILVIYLVVVLIEAPFIAVMESFKNKFWYEIKD